MTMPSVPRKRPLACRGGKVRTDEPFFGKVIGTRTCRRKDVRAGLAKVRDNGFTDSFGPACDKRPKALKFECGAHQ